MQIIQDIISLFIYERAAHTLFDMGVTISFIAFRIVDFFDIFCALLGESLLVATLVGKLFLATRICKRCELSFESYILKADLIVLDTANFDIILGMDWFYLNQVHVNC